MRRGSRAINYLLSYPKITKSPKSDGEDSAMPNPLPKFAYAGKCPPPDGAVGYRELLLSIHSSQR